MKKLLSIVLSIVMMVGVVSAVPVSAAPGDVTFFGGGSFAVDVLRWPNDPIDDNFIDTQYYINVGGVIYTYRDEVDYGPGNLSYVTTRPDKNLTTLTFKSEVPFYDGDVYKVYNAIVDNPKHISHIKEIIVEDEMKSISGINNCNSLEKIYIGKDVENISDCFYGCENLKEIVIDEENKHLQMVGDEIYRISENKKELICAFNPAENYIVKDDVTAVDNPFGDNEKVKSVTINKDLEQFYIYGSESIEEIIIGKNVKEVKTFSVPSLTKIKELDLSKILVEYLKVTGCTSLESIRIPDTIKELTNSAFADCENLESIVLPEGIKVIPYGTFENCKKLKNVELPTSVRIIYNDAFSGCKNLESVVIPNIKTICRDTFEGCKKLNNVVIPDSVTQLKEDAFKGCKSLTNITLSKNLKYIGRNAFYGSGLEEITIPATVNRIYRDAFKFTKIKKVTFEHKEKAPIIKKAIFPTKNKITVNVYSENKKIAKKLKARLKNRVYKANIYSNGKLIYKNVK